jgi:hypothetical protein
VVDNSWIVRATGLQIKSSLVPFFIFKSHKHRDWHREFFKLEVLQLVDLGIDLSHFNPLFRFDRTTTFF